MRLFIVLLSSCIFLFSCNDQSKGPDVSDIKISLPTQRFEQDLFDSLSPITFDRLQLLRNKYPKFLPLFLNEILGMKGANQDTLLKYTALFAKDYTPIKDSADKIFTNFEVYQKEIVKGLQHIRYNFPKYPLPKKIITYVGPLDGYGDIFDADDSALIIGLHHHIGKDFSAYKTTLVQETYATYISNRFEPDYIVVNCMKNIINDMYPISDEDKSLINQMIEKGKRLYLLSKFLPDTKEYQLIGYSEKQLKDCYKEEAKIWDMFIRNSYLQLIDKNAIKNYVEESPKTQELGEEAPGNIGSFAGWQIVKKYMQKNAAVTPQQLMSLDNETIFTNAKYKP